MRISQLSYYIHDKHHIEGRRVMVDVLGKEALGAFGGGGPVLLGRE